MPLVSLGNIIEIEFGVCLKEAGENEYYLIPTAGPLKPHFREMLRNTLSPFPGDPDEIEDYDPAQSYSGNVCLKLSLNSPLVQDIEDFFNLVNIPLNATKIENDENIIFYFCIFRHQNGIKTIGIRRAGQFKVVTNQKLISLCDDTLEFIRGKFFKLDSDFDFIVTHERIFIHRVTGFETFAHMNEVILQNARENTVALGERLTFIHTERLEIYNQNHMRAARLIASIVARPNLEAISRELLMAECQWDGVVLEEINGKISPEGSSEFGFLNVLDRRRYHMSLIPEVDEIYEAANRHGIN
jgi:hypothetical protein